MKQKDSEVQREESHTGPLELLLLTKCAFTSESPGARREIGRLVATAQERHNKRPCHTAKQRLVESKFRRGFQSPNCFSCIAEAAESQPL